MFKLALFVLAVAAAALALTNPGRDAHKQTIYAAVASQTTESPLFGKLAADVLGNADVVPVTYNNYYVFSTTTLNGKTATVGAGNRVWKLQQ